VWTSYSPTLHICGCATPCATGRGFPGGSGQPSLGPANCVLRQKNGIAKTKQKPKKASIRKCGRLYFIRKKGKKAKKPEGRNATYAQDAGGEGRGPPSWREELQQV